MEIMLCLCRSASGTYCRCFLPESTFAARRTSFLHARNTNATQLKQTQHAMTGFHVHLLSLATSSRRRCRSASGTYCRCYANRWAAPVLPESTFAARRTSFLHARNTNATQLKQTQHAMTGFHVHLLSLATSSGRWCRSASGTCCRCFLPESTFAVRRTLFLYARNTNATRLKQTRHAMTGFHVHSRNHLHPRHIVRALEAF
ncbi:MAG: hypothetical protein U0996_23225 [Planctomycetaceae bacterium]